MVSFRVADRVVGEILTSKNVFVTHRKQEHFFRFFNGFGLNEKILVELWSRGVLEVWIYFEGVERLELWKAKVVDWLEKGRVYSWKGNFEEHVHQKVIEERQRILGKEYFKVL